MINEITKGRSLDLILLLLITSLPVFSMETLFRPVITLLLALIFTMAFLLIPDQKWYHVLFLCLLGITFFLPELTFFLPLFLYSSIRYGKIYHLAGILILFRAQELYDQESLLALLILCMLALILAFRSQKLNSLHTEYIQLRDATTEWNMALKKKNKDLMEKQDYEIYLATLRERNRIAREIHDNVGHMLSRSILQIGALRTIHKESPLNEQLSSVNDTLNQAMNSIRESVHDLHDESIDLRQAILEATADLQTKYQIRMDYDLSENVPRNIKYGMIAIIKEALSNTVKHSNATEILLMLREHPGFYQLAIEDNGSVPKKNVDSGIGLTNMQDRVTALGGTMYIKQERGFCIFISLPKS